MGYARLIMLALAAVAAGAAAFLVQGLIASNKPVQTAQKPETATTEVLVAAKNLDLGTKVTSADIKWQVWPQAAVTDAYIVKSTSPEAQNETQGSVVRQAMLAGEPVTSNKVVRSDSTGFMAAMLTAGMRASSVKISAETGAGGFILPNDRVDVILTSQGENGGRNGNTSRTILSNVRVLAIDQTYKGEGDERVVIGKTATLELTSAQSEVLARADASGTVSLALRSLTDGDVKSGDVHSEAIGSMTVLRYGTATEVNVNGATQ